MVASPVVDIVGSVKNTSPKFDELRAIALNAPAL
jgi:hypothetical protein